MERHCYNAMLVAKWLETSSHISKVIYPGLSNHPQHSIALEQMPKGFGAMISIYLKVISIKQRFLGKTQNLYFS